RSSSTATAILSNSVLGPTTRRRAGADSAWESAAGSVGRYAALEKLKGSVDEIYIVACQAADDPFPGTLNDGDGKMLCSELARYPGAYVYASDATQNPGGRERFKYGHIDGFEGTVYRWGPNGTLTGSRRRWRMGRWESAGWLHST